MLTPKQIIEFVFLAFLFPVTVCAEPAFDNLWAYRLYPEQKALTGQGVAVAVADSGINSHPEFNGKNIQGQDFTLSPSLADMKNHGTGIAGIIGARGVQFTGIAPNSQIVVYKIDDGSRMISPQAATSALHTILAYNKENPGQKIAVVNLSYGIQGGGNVPLTNAINQAYESGVAVICPAGNLGPSSPRRPICISSLSVPQKPTITGRARIPSFRGSPRSRRRGGLINSTSP